eukprot:SAG31_NODE_4631_length_3085_cov_1.693570_2_plen_300_part_00
MIHCRMMEVQAACCSDARNCPDDSPVPRRCPVECALVFPSLVQSCPDELEEDGVEVDEFRSFADRCTRQDTTALVEYAASLVAQGCILNFEADGEGAQPDRGRRRTEGYRVLVHEPVPRRHPDAFPQFAHATRRLQGEGEANPACKDFIDDPNGDLAASGVDCEQVLLLGCRTDLHSSQPNLPEGSLISRLCPVSCNECHRSGMAKMVEAALDCPWDGFAGRLDETNGVCCGDDPDRACADGEPPPECSSLCAVIFHKLVMDCGDMLLSLAGEANADDFVAFDSLVYPHTQPPALDSVK